MKFSVEIKIGLKDGIIDPEGLNTKKALEMLGFSGISEVFTTKSFVVVLESRNEEGAKSLAEEMCNRLLANPVINSYEISVKKA